MWIGDRYGICDMFLIDLHRGRIRIRCAFVYQRTQRVIIWYGLSHNLTNYFTILVLSVFNSTQNRSPRRRDVNRLPLFTLINEGIVIILEKASIWTTSCEIISSIFADVPRLCKWMDVRQVQSFCVKLSRFFTFITISCNSPSPWLLLSFKTSIYFSSLFHSFGGSSVSQPLKNVQVIWNSGTSMSIKGCILEEVVVRTNYFSLIFHV